jgi:excisionase family DNA binding protein
MIVTVRQLAEELKVTKFHIYHLAQAGKIPSFRVGSAWRFDRDEVIDHLKHPSIPLKRQNQVNLLYP